MNEAINGYAAAAIAVGLLFALAGLGWWRMACARFASAAFAALAAAGAGAVTFGILKNLKITGGGSGEWAGLGVLMLAFFAVGAVFLAVFVTAMIVVSITKRVIFRREKFSWVLSGIALFFFVAGGAAFQLNTPHFASDAKLVRHVERNWGDSESEDEAVRRGARLIPAITAELRRLETPGEKDWPPHQVPPLLKILGRIGGAEARAELHRWAEGKAELSIRISAMTALAKMDDRTVEPLIVTALGKSDRVSDLQVNELIEALGALNATNQISAIRAAVFREQSYVGPMLRQTSVSVLAKFGTDEAWAVITEICADKNDLRRGDALTALRKIPGPRSLAIAAEALDSPSQLVREAAWWTVKELDPKSVDSIPGGYSDENAKKLREALKAK